MLEPLTALSVASSIVQLVEFSWDLIASSYDAFKSAEGSNRRNEEIARQTAELRTVNAGLCRFKPAAGQIVPESEVLLFNLARKSMALSKELLDVMEELRVKKIGRGRALNSVWKQVKGVRKSDKILDIERRLDIIQNQVNTCLLELLRSVVRLADSVRVPIALGHSINRYYRDRQSSTMITLDSLTNINEDIRTEIRSLVQQVIAHTKGNNKELAGLRAAIDQLASESRCIAKRQYILDSLYFAEIDERRVRIKDTYPKTFSWIFEQDKTPFKDWLELSDGTFWVSGKAGSGKSTLMKFVSEHPETGRILDIWAGNSKLIVASFFFWHSGTHLQKSQQSLLRSLLFTILRHCPDVIPDVCPKRWNSEEHLLRSPPSWSRQELSDVLHAIVQFGSLRKRFCFFIDGLDEYAGEHDSLISDLSSIASSPNVKLCVSSRPWNVFKNAYGAFEEHMFELQDLTEVDMDIYIKGRLEEDPQFVDLCHRDPCAEELVQDIRTRACGVFLWVFLVVRSLRRGLTERDSIKVLRRRLEDVPSDLETYFQRMFDSLDKAYKVYTAQALQLALHAAEPLPLLT